MSLNSLFFSRLSQNNNSTATGDKKPIDNTNSTASDLSVEDVLKKINNLNPDKRNRLMNLLRKNATDNDEIDDVLAVVSDEDVEVKTKKPKTGKKMESSKSKTGESIEDEVEILEIDEPKMGTYKRKRSKF